MTQLTRKAIMEAFIRLLNERSYDKIKVKDIVEECGINRNTFYYHFEDIPALVEEILRLETERVLGLGAEEIMDSWENAFIRAADFALQNKRAIYHIYNSVGRDVIEHYLNAIASDVMVRFVEKTADGLSVSEEDKKLIIRFYRSALVGLIVDWLEAGMKYDPRVLIYRLGQLFEGNILLSLQRSIAVKSE